MAPAEPVENQEVAIKCFANKYEFSSASWERRPFSQGTYSPVVAGDSAFQLRTESTEYSRVVILVIPLAHSRLDGQYRCVAVNRTSGSKKLSSPVDLTVLREFFAFVCLYACL